MKEAEIRGTYTTPVSFKMVVLTLLAWLFGKELEIRDVLITKKNS